jgi:hypothetical protein
VFLVRRRAALADCGPRDSGQTTAVGESHQSAGIRIIRGRRGDGVSRADTSSGCLADGCTRVLVGSVSS